MGRQTVATAEQRVTTTNDAIAKLTAELADLRQRQTAENLERAQIVPNLQSCLPAFLDEFIQAGGHSAAIEQLQSLLGNISKSLSDWKQQIQPPAMPSSGHAEQHGPQPMEFGFSKDFEEVDEAFIEQLKTADHVEFRKRMAEHTVAATKKQRV